MDDADQPLPNYYVAVGASAGGLEALQDFFGAMPSKTGMAFMVIQHLSPDFKSVMAQLLSRHTEMEIFNATDGAQVLADKIYLIPPRKNMMIAEGRLLLVDQMPERGINFPIDIFFRSLAEDQHHRSIGIVLSGTGSDGSRGIHAIKEVGGLIIAQDPATAKFDGMPYSAVKTGLADVVVGAGQMGEKLVQFITHPVISGEDQSIMGYARNSEGTLQDIFTLLKERSEIDFTQYKTTTVARRIERRIGINDMSSVEEYHKLLMRSPQEIQTLAKDMLIGVTRFFRDPESFEVIEKTAIPAILASIEPDEPIRVWVAGCSTGEEAYSVAMLFDEALANAKKTNVVKIFATDVDPDAIEEASSGVFHKNIAEDVGPERLQKYFTEKDEHLEVNPKIRKMVVFANHNLIKDPPFSNTHLALCRIVLIYFQNEAQQRVLAMLNFSLRRSGYLFLGSSESLGEMQSYFEVVNERAKVFKKVSRARAASNIPAVRSNPHAGPPSVESLINRYQDNQKSTHNYYVVESLISDYVPACIVLNADLNVLHVYGDVSRYTQKLRSGRFSANIKDIVREELSIAVATAVHRALTQEESVQYDNIQLRESDGSVILVSLRVRYVAGTNMSQVHLLIIFEEHGVADKVDGEEVIVYDPGNQSQQRILDLEVQLQKNQEHLQVTVEELETTNEELQSSNEELLSANEELQSTNEELQSVNEELYTVNSEYQQKIDELTQVNSDLDLSMRSANVGIIFLDDAMLIRNFNQTATIEVNLLKSDVGRPFHHISHHLLYEGLLNDIASVIDKSEPVEKEVRSKNDSVYVIKIEPYVNDLQETHGCIITLTDVTRLWYLQSKLTESYQELRDTISAAFIQSTRKTIDVLIVDDMAADRSAIRRALDGQNTERQPYNIVEAASINEAAELLKECKFDVCLIDYLLGDRTALDFLTGIEGGDKTLPAFIMISGVIDTTMAEEAIRLGVYDTIDKGEVNPALLDRCIRYALRQKRTEEYLQKQYVERNELADGETSTKSLETEASE